MRVQKSVMIALSAHNRRIGMHWYYASEGTQLGPYQKQELEQLVLSGKITSETLVWHEGMQEWSPYGLVKVPDLPPAPPLAEPSAQAATEPCSECGRFFAQEDLLR